MNTLNATITAIKASDHLSILSVDIGEDRFHLLLAEASHEPIGTSVTLAFKETEITLSKHPLITTANCAKGIVQKISRGVILSQVTFTYHDMTLKALVPTLTFETLSIDEGDTIYWIVQPSEISLLRETHGI